MLAYKYNIVNVKCESSVKIFYNNKVIIFFVSNNRINIDISHFLLRKQYINFENNMIYS